MMIIQEINQFAHSHMFNKCKRKDSVTSYLTQTLALSLLPKHKVRETGRDHSQGFKFTAYFHQDHEILWWSHMGLCTISFVFLTLQINRRATDWIDYIHFDLFSMMASGTGLILLWPSYFREKDSPEVKIM